MIDDNSYQLQSIFEKSSCSTKFLINLTMHNDTNDGMKRQMKLKCDEKIYFQLYFEQNRSMVAQARMVLFV